MGNKPKLLFKRYQIKLVTFLISLLLMPCVLTGLSAQDVSLFEWVDSSESEWVGMQAADIQRSAVTIQDDVLEGIRTGLIQEFTISDLSGNSFVIEVRRIINQLDGDWSMTGHIRGDWMDGFILSYSQGEILSSFRQISEHHFLEVRFKRDQNQHFLIHIDPHEREELQCEHDHDLIVPDDAESSLIDGNLIPDTIEQPVVVDVMIVYTPAAESWANSSGGGINNVINQAMAIAQRSADNARLNLEFRLVHRTRVSYNESWSSSRDLENLTFNRVPNVHNMRNQYGADLVSMFTRANDVGGVTWAMFNRGGASAYAYSIIRVQQAGWSSILAHELGHNFGNHHSRNQRTSRAPLSGGVFSYSTGWRWTGTNGRSYASVMTYRESSTMVDIFSNPDVTYAGTPSGSYTGTGAPADNARSMNNMKGVIASYRATTVVMNPPTVATSNVTSVTRSSATGGGNVSSDGGASVTVRGICWSQNQSPGFSDSCRSSGSGTGSFSATMSALTPGTTYYVRAYATNSVGSSFGSAVSFTTDQIQVDPILSTIESSRTKVQANNQDSATITITARDLTNVRLAGFPTSLRARSGTLQSTPQSVTTNSNGQAIFEVTNSRVEQVQYTAVSGGVELQSSVTVSYIGIDPQLSDMRVDSTVIEADGEKYAEIRILARDEDGLSFGNIDMNLIPNSGSSVIEAVRRRTDSEGVAIFRVSNQAPERVTYSASALGTTIEQTVTVNFIPRAPVALAASDVETRSFAANWEVASGASGYLLDLSRDNSFDSFVQGYNNRTTGNVTFYLISDASPGTDYYYRVRAEVDGLVSANSEVIAVTTFPDIPIALSASERNALEFTATWQPADGARWYEVDVAEDMLFETILTDYENIEVKQGTSLTVEGLEPGRDYFYRIRSVAGIRRSEYSEVAQTSTLSISAENSTIAQNQLRILANGLQTNPVQVEVKSEEGVLLRNLRVKLEADSGSPIIEEIQPVTDENGIAHFALTSPEASKVTFNVIAHNTTVGNFTVEFLANEGILALGNNYPNPFNGKTILPVTVPRQMMIHIIVYDTLGKPIMNVIREELETGYYEIPVSASGLASGLYFYRLYTEDKILIDSMTLIR